MGETREAATPPRPPRPSGRGRRNGRRVDSTATAGGAMVCAAVAVARVSYCVYAKVAAAPPVAPADGPKASAPPGAGRCSIASPRGGRGVLACAASSGGGAGAPLGAGEAPRGQGRSTRSPCRRRRVGGPSPTEMSSRRPPSASDRSAAAPSVPRRRRCGGRATSRRWRRRRRQRRRSAPSNRHRYDSCASGSECRPGSAPGRRLRETDRSPESGHRVFLLARLTAQAVGGGIHQPRIALRLGLDESLNLLPKPLTRLNLPAVKLDRTAQCAADCRMRSEACTPQP